MGLPKFIVVALGIACSMADQRIQVNFLNKGKTTAKLNWVSAESRVAIGDIAPGSSIGQDTYVGHRFEAVVDGFEPNIIKVQNDGTVFFEGRGKKVEAWGDALTYKEKKDIYKGEKWDAIVAKVRKDCEETFAEQPLDKAWFCDKRHDRRMFNMAKLDHDDATYERMMQNKQRQRIRDTARQPHNLHNFTEVGFKVLEVPPELHRKLSDFHKRTRISSSRPESMPFDDPNLSGRDSDTWLSDLPPQLKEEMFLMVKERIVEWSGVAADDLTKTALFGIRMYHKGSILFSHCDRKDTHVLSAIVEIGRADPEDKAPWPLTITDHAGTVHEIPDRPGQLILYESATCAHGRIAPFPGREMANAFVHFKPVGWPEKYTYKSEL